MYRIPSSLLVPGNGLSATSASAAASSNISVGAAAAPAATPSKDPKVKEEDTILLFPVPKLARSIRPAGKLSETKINLYNELTLKQVAGTPFTATFAIQPGLSSEFADVANLYDEIRVLGGIAHFVIRTNGATAYTTDTGVQACVLAYDPMDSTALGSVLNGLQHSQHLLFAPPQGPLGFTAAPLPMTANGLFHFKWSVPNRSARRTGSAGVNFGASDWSDTADNTATYGYFKPYIPSFGATGFVQWKCT